MIGIIGSISDEVTLLVSMLKDPSHIFESGLSFWQGRLGNQPVVISTCGVGKVFASMCATIMVSKFNVASIINTGVAGGLAEGLKPGDFALATGFIQHDYDTSPIDNVSVGYFLELNTALFQTDFYLTSKLRLALAGERFTEGTIVSGDKFIADKETALSLRKTFKAIACEMEGGAIAQVCRITSRPFAALRCISDTADGQAVDDFSKFVSEAAEKSSRIVAQMLSL
jgi:adenosylhomocysteine nucleosidase